MSLDEHSPSHPGQQAYQAPPAQPGTSGLAIAGLVLAFLVAPVGFILSLIAVFKTGAGRLKGRGLAITGLIVSVLVMGAFVTAGLIVANAKVLDPGCVAAKDALQASAKSAEPSSLQATIDGLNAAAAKAKHDDVRAATKTLADDYAVMLNGVQTGNMPADLVQKVEAHAGAFDKLCTVGS